MATTDPALAARSSPGPGSEFPAPWCSAELPGKGLASGFLNPGINPRTFPEQLQQTPLLPGFCRLGSRFALDVEAVH